MAAAFILLTGCATPQKSGFLTGNEPMHQGHYLRDFWSAGQIPKHMLSQIYIEPIDVTRIQDAPDMSVSVASNFLAGTIVFQIRAKTGWVVVEHPDAATAKIALAITYMTPGSTVKRALAAELGAGHAYVQVDGKLIDASTGKDIAVFSDRRSDSGSAGFEDLGGDAGPRLVRRMMESICVDFVKELAETTN